jgi:hypothetical protein
VPVDNIALGRVIGTPEVVDDLVAGQETPRVRSEQVEQILLQGSKVQLMSADCHAAVQDVDLQFSKLQNWGEKADFAVGTPHHSQNPSDKLFGRERDRQYIVDAAVKCSELRLEVTPPRQGDDRDSLRSHLGLSKPFDHFAVADVHVENG